MRNANGGVRRGMPDVAMGRKLRGRVVVTTLRG